MKTLNKSLLGRKCLVKNHNLVSVLLPLRKRKRERKKQFPFYVNGNVNGSQRKNANGIRIESWLFRTNKNERY